MARDLPTLSSRGPRCPFAEAIAGASRAMQGVVCRAMHEDAQEHDGLRMTPRALEVLRESEGGIYLNLKSDPSSVTGFCYGTALPKQHDGEPARAHYTFCPVWEAWDERRRVGKDGLYDEPEPEPVSMGVDEDGSAFLSTQGPPHTLEAADPWAQARADLDELAPEPAR